MSTGSRLHLLAGMSVGALLGSTSAWAEAAAGSDASAPPSNAIAEVVVTARRVQENLQNVPVAVTAVTNATLARHNIYDAEDLQYIAPGLVVQGGSYNRVGISYAVRGTPAGDTLIYRNEVPELFVPSIGGAIATPYYDLDSVQVLKGPQGTLFGGTATGGAVLVTTARPTNDFGGYLQFTYGNYNAVYAEGALNLPIVPDKVLLRLSFDDRHRDGYTYNVYDGHRLDNTNTASGRISLIIRPTDNITNTTVYDFNYRREIGGNPLPILCNASGGLNANALTGVQDPNNTWYKACEASVKLGPRATDQNVDGLSGLRQHFLSNITEANFGDVVVKNIFGYEYDLTDNRNDGDGTAVTSPPGVGTSATSNPFPDLIDNVTEQYSEELQLQGKAFDRRLSWIVGGFYESTWDPHSNHLVADVGYPFLVNVISQEKATESAVFTQETYDLRDVVKGLSITGGVRSTWDNNSTLTGNNACNFPTATNNIPECVTFANVGDLFTPGFTGFSTTAGAIEVHSNSHAITYNITANYQPIDGLMIYYTRRRGYRPGGVNAFAPQNYAGYLPETVDDNEIGLKSEFHAMSVPMRLNIAAYDDDFQNMQRQATINSTTGDITVNAQDATLMGVELDATAVLTDWFTLDASWDHMDNKFNKYDVSVAGGNNAGGGGSTATVDELGAPFPLAPKNSYSVTATVKAPLPAEWGRLIFTANYDYRTTTYLALDTFYQRQIQQGDYGLLNLQLHWASAFGSPVDVTIFAKNVTNQVYIDGTGVQAYTPNPFQLQGIDAVFYGEPATYGVTLRYHFGGQR